MNRRLPVLQIDSSSSTRVNNVLGTSGSFVVPTLDNGDKPKFVYVQSLCDVPGQAVYISPEVSATAAVIATALPIVAGAGGIILDVSGSSHIGYEGDGSVNLDIYVTPLHNQDLSRMAVSMRPASATQAIVSNAGSSVAIPELFTGVETTYLLCQAVIGNNTNAGDAITVSPEHGAATGSKATGLAIVIGSEPVILNVKGYSHIAYDLAAPVGIDAHLSLVPLASQ